MAITLGGSGSGGSAALASSVATGAFAVQPTAGSLIVVGVAWQWDSASSDTVTNITDNASGNIYTRIGSQVEDNSNGHRAVLYYAPNIATAASFVVTANFTAGVGERRIWAVEFKGAATASPVGVSGGQQQTNPGTATNAVTTGNLGTPGENGHGVFSFVATDAVPTFTAGTGYTGIGTINPGGGASIAFAQYLIQTTAAAVAATCTVDDAAADTLSVAASFKEAVAGGTTLYLLNSTASGSNFGSLQFGGTAPSTETTGTGWTVDTVGSGNYARMAYATERASSTFSGTAQPSGAPDNTLGDCWRSSSALSGDFATGVWTIAVPVIAVTAAAGQDGRVRVRLWRSTSATGASATEITSGAVAGTTVTNLATGAEQLSTVTTASITGFTLANEYLFVQVAWEITGAAA